MAQPFYRNDLKFLTHLRGAMPGVMPAFSSEGRSPRIKELSGSIGPIRAYS
jgi:hypothetical protein